MRPANGSYRLTTIATPGLPSTSVVYTVTDAGIPTTFGLLAWDPNPPPGAFRHGDIALRFLDDGDSFVAINGLDNYAGTYEPA